MNNNTPVTVDRLLDVDDLLTGLLMGNIGENQIKDLSNYFIKEKTTESINLVNQKATSKVAEIFSSSEYISIKQLADTDLPDKLVAMVPALGTGIQKYVSGTMKREELTALIKSSSKNMASELLNAYGIDTEFYAEAIKQIQSLSPAIVSYICFTEVYKITMSVMNDAELAYEKRIQIEKECAESIENIKRYREHMEDVVSSFLADKIERFESGFKAIDEAILSSDTEGYIKGNVTIQEALGYKPRFTNQEEFDDLMLSDEAFKF